MCIFQCICVTKLICAAGSLPYLVLDLRVDQYFLKVDTQRVPQTYHPHYNTIRFCLRVVSPSRIYRTPLSPPEDNDTRSKAWHQISQPRGCGYDHASGPFSNWWSHTLFHGHRKDPSIPRPHNQGVISAFHSSSLPLHIQHPLSYLNVSLAYSSYPWRCTSL